MNICIPWVVIVFLRFSGSDFWFWNCLLPVVYFLFLIDFSSDGNMPNAEAFAVKLRTKNRKLRQKLSGISRINKEQSNFWSAAYKWTELHETFNSVGYGQINSGCYSNVLFWGRLLQIFKFNISCEQWNG